MSKTSSYAADKPRNEASTQKHVTDAEIDSSVLGAEAFLATCKKVPIRLPLADPTDKYVEVGYNGFMMLIKRGETVEVPEPVYDILRQSGRFF